MQLFQLIGQIVLQNNASQALNQIEQSVANMQNKLNNAAQSVSKFGGGVSSLGAKATATATASVAGIGTAAISTATQFSESQTKMQNSLGLTEKQSKEMNDKAKSIWKSGFGESIDEVSNSMLTVKQNMQGLNDSELEKVTKNAMTLGKTFDADVGEVTRGAQNIMKNFGVDADKAFDLMANGAQNGLNFSGEMFDNLAEYAPLWSDMGYSAEEMFGMLQSGAKNGVYNLDYLNDGMKEFQIRATDGSKSTSDALEEMSPATRKVWKEYEKGKATVADMAKAAEKDLSKIDNKVKRNELGVALFGTKWEDLGGDVVLNMVKSGDAVDKFKGKMDKMNKTSEESFGQKWNSFKRTTQDALLPLGKILMKLAEEYMPIVIEKVTKLAKWFENLSPKGKKIALIITGIVAAIGPLLMILGTLISSITPIILIFSKATGIISLFSKGLALVSGPVGWVVLAIGALIAIGIAVYKNWDKIGPKLKKAWDKIKEIWSTFINSIKDKFSNKVSQIKSIFSSLKEFFVAIWSKIKSAFTIPILYIVTFVKRRFFLIKKVSTEIWTSIYTKISEIAKKIKTSVSNIFSKIKDVVSKPFILAKVKIAEVINKIKTTVSNGFSKIKDLISKPLISAKDRIKTVFSVIYEVFSKVTSKLKNIISRRFSAMKNAMTNPISKAKDKIKEIIDKIKGFFSKLKLKIPKISLPKMPKIKISGNFSLKPGKVSVPKLSWNAKGGIFKKPTIFNTANQGLQGVGEAGAEAIVPLDSLKSWVTDSIKEGTGSRLVGEASTINDILSSIRNVKGENKQEVNNIFNINGNWVVDSDERQMSIVEQLSEELTKRQRARGVK